MLQLKHFLKISKFLHSNIFSDIQSPQPKHGFLTDSPHGHLELPECTCTNMQHQELTPRCWKTFSQTAESFINSSAHSNHKENGRVYIDAYQVTDIPHTPLTTYRYIQRLGRRQIYMRPGHWQRSQGCSDTSQALAVTLHSFIHSTNMYWVLTVWEGLFNEQN